MKLLSKQKAGLKKLKRVSAQDRMHHDDIDKEVIDRLATSNCHQRLSIRFLEAGVRCLRV